MQHIQPASVSSRASYGASVTLGEAYVLIGSPEDNSDMGAVFVLPR